jgi:hypothetical protein
MHGAVDSVNCGVQVKYHRGLKLVACLLTENRVVIHDLKTSERKVIELEQPWKCAVSQYLVAVSTFELWAASLYNRR